jgi:Kef-type K+ transport system membrane component KefB
MMPWLLELVSSSHLSHLAHLLGQLAVILVAAKLAGELAQRLGQSSVLGELVAGVLIGPFALGLVTLDEFTHTLMELGVIFLLFETGMETNLKQLLKVGGQAMAVAGVGVALPFALGYGLGHFALGLPTMGSLMIGATLTATSIGITARTLNELGEMDSPEGRIIIGAAVLDDVLGLMLLGLMQALVSTGNFRPDFLAVKVVVSLAVLWALGKWFTIPLFNFVDTFKTKALVPVAIAFILALSVLGEVGGLSVVIGAFAAGLLLNRTRQQGTLHHELAPLTQFFAPMFFVVVGAQLNIALLNPFNPANWKLLALAVGLSLLATVGKVAAGFVTWQSSPSAAPLRQLFIGVGMVPRGEVGLIFAQVGLSSGVLNEMWFSVLVLTVFITTFITPPLLVAIQKASLPPVVPLDAQPTEAY